MSVSEIETQVDSIAEKLGLFPSVKYGPLPQDLSDAEQDSYVLSDSAYHYVYVEKRRERRRQTTSDLDELLYWIFWDVSLGAAMNYEMRHRHPYEDFRRQLFDLQTKTLEKISVRWGERAQQQIANILSSTPFVDIN